jgi:Tfp pilus assembly protein PilO
MGHGQQTLIVLMTLSAAVLLGGGYFVLDAYREASAVHQEINGLETKIAGLSGTAEQVERLSDEVDAMQKRLDRDYKYIPDTPDVASMMRKLSMPVDGTSVIDQTFTAGSETPAVAGVEDGASAMPLTIDMIGRFDSIFALMQAAESMKRLVRLASVRLEVDRENENLEPGFVTASIGLEVVYEDSSGGEVH